MLVGIKAEAGGVILDELHAAGLQESKPCSSTWPAPCVCASGLRTCRRSSWLPARLPVTDAGKLIGSSRTMEARVKPFERLE